MEKKEIMRAIQAFSFKVEKMILIKHGVIQLKTKDNTFCLKKMNLPMARLKWMDQVFQRASAKGFNKIAWQDPSHPYGKPPTPYILTPWIQGHLPSPFSEGELLCCASQLANFHQINRSFPRNMPGEYNRLGKWPFHFQQVLKKITPLFQQMKYPQIAKWEKIIRKRADYAMNLLEKSDYLPLCKSEEAQTICHGDSGPKNFIMAADGVYLIDFETLRRDLRIYDLFRFIRLTCKNRGWNFTIARSILEGYQVQTPLSKEEFDLLAIWLWFPHKGGKVLQSKQFYRINQVMEDEKEISSFIGQLQKYGEKMGK